MNALLIDIGNSRIKWRIVDTRVDWPLTDDAADNAHDNDTRSAAESGWWDLADLSQLESRFFKLREYALDAIDLSNVAEADVEIAIKKALYTTWGDVPISSLTPSANQCGVVNGYRDPSQLGPDRWAAMLGAHALFLDQHLLVCNLGTATTIDLLVANSGGRARFAGGLILPGVEVMRRALARDTARLPLARGEVLDFATGTDDAITSGIAAAQSGAIARAVRHAQRRIAIHDRERDESSRLLCILAGGGARTIAAHLDDFDVAIRIVPDLVLRGLDAIVRDRHQRADTISTHTDALVSAHSCPTRS